MKKEQDGVVVTALKTFVNILVIGVSLIFIAIVGW